MFPAFRAGVFSSTHKRARIDWQVKILLITCHACIEAYFVFGDRKVMTSALLADKAPPKLCDTRKSPLTRTVIAEKRRHSFFGSWRIMSFDPLTVSSIVGSGLFILAMTQQDFLQWCTTITSAAIVLAGGAMAVYKSLRKTRRDEDSADYEVLKHTIAGERAHYEEELGRLQEVREHQARRIVLLEDEISLLKRRIGPNPPGPPALPPPAK